MRRNFALFLGLILVSILFFAFENPTSPANNPSIQVNNNANPDSVPVDDAVTVYDQLQLADKGLSFNVFESAWHGYTKLAGKNAIKKQVLSIVDMSQPSSKKRLYIIDMAAKKLLVNTLVAHGKNSGETKATKFSNIESSLQTSLGFYVTGGTYDGSNGYSMKLKGMEKGFNDRAESRAIVMHGAPYVSEAIARQTGRIGRSWGCPAVSVKEHKQIIDLIKNGSCLFVFAPEKQYLAQSSLVGSDMGSL